MRSSAAATARATVPGDGVCRASIRATAGEPAPAAHSEYSSNNSISEESVQLAAKRQQIARTCI